MGVAEEVMCEICETKQYTSRVSDWVCMECGQRHRSGEGFRYNVVLSQRQISVLRLDHNNNIQQMSVKDGDVVVIRADFRSRVDMETFKEQLKADFPELRFMILPENMNLSVLSGLVS